MNDVTTTLARFAVEATPGESPRHAARRTILNALALAVGANDHPAVARLRSVLAAFGGSPSAALLGRNERMPAAWAAMVNGAAAHVEDFDDTHLRTIVHPGAPIVPAALATAEHVDASASEFVDAVCIGVEVALRVATGMCPEHFDRGWHPTGTMGVIGAAVASGRLLGLDDDGMRRAMGLAAVQSAGLLAQLGTMTKSFHPGKAAANGVEAALLTQRGFTAPLNVIEGRRGLNTVAGHGASLDGVTDDLGVRWELEANAFKPYACGIVSHPVLDGALALREAAGPGADWERVVARVNPVVLEVMGVRDVHDHLSSKFSVYHCAALGLAGYAGGIESFTDAAATDAHLDALRGRVEIELDPSVRRDEASLEGVTSDGATHRHHVDHARGSVQRPLTDSELIDKATRVSSPVLGDDQSANLAELVLSIGPGGPALDHIIQTCRPAA